MSALRDLNIAVCQCGAGVDPRSRLDHMQAVLHRIGRHDGADLAVFPELYMSGYNVGSLIRQYAETVDGRFARAVSELSYEYGLNVAYGYPELHGDGMFNSVLCVGSDGRILANHRKTRLPPGNEQDVFTRGNRPTFLDIAGWRVAILICYEAEFPELVRAAARGGAALVIVPTALSDEWGFVAHKLMPTRAFENGVYLAYANYAGVGGDLRYLGASCIIAPDGRELARAGNQTELLAGVLEYDRIATARHRLPYLHDQARAG